MFGRVEPVFGNWASLVIHAGDPGAGTRMKLARNMLTFTAFAAACESMRLAEASGVDLQALGRVVRHTDALTNGPGAVMIRDTMHELEPGGTGCTTASPIPAIWGKDLNLALALGSRSASARRTFRWPGRRWAAWPPDSVCCTRTRSERWTPTTCAARAWTR